MQSPTLTSKLRLFLLQIDRDLTIPPELPVQALISKLAELQKRSVGFFSQFLETLLHFIQCYMIELENSEVWMILEPVADELSVCDLGDENRRIWLIRKFYGIACQAMADVNLMVHPSWYEDQNNWKIEREGMGDIDPDAMLIWKCRKMIEKLGRRIGAMKIFEIIEDDALGMYSYANWRWKYAVMMSMYELSEGLVHKKVQNFFKLIVMSLQNVHAKVRSAGYCALARYSKCQLWEIKKEYFNRFLSVIMKEGLKDKVQKVAGQAMECLGSLINNCPSASQIPPSLTLSRNLSKLLSQISTFLTQSPPANKASALSTFHCLAKILNLFTSSSIERYFQSCKYILLTEETAKNGELVGAALRCMAVGLWKQWRVASRFFQEVGGLLGLFWERMEKDVAIEVWKILCKLKRLNEWQPIFQKILSLITSTPVQQLPRYLPVLLQASRCYKRHFHPQTFSILEFLNETLLAALQKTYEEAGKLLIQCMEKLVSQAREYNWGDCGEWVQGRWGSFMGKLAWGYLGEVLKLGLKGMFSNLIELMQFVVKLLNQCVLVLSQEDLWHMSERCINMVVKFQNMKAQYLQQNSTAIINEMSQSEQSFDDEAVNCINRINQLKMAIVDALQILVKQWNSLRKTGKLAKKIQEHVDASMAGSKDDLDLAYVMKNLAVMIQDYEFQFLPARIYDCVRDFATSTTTVLRIYAIKGLGFLVQRTPEEIVNIEAIQGWLQVAGNCYEMPKTRNERLADYEICRETCVGVLGRILMQFRNKFDLNFLYDKWLIRLPLKLDKLSNKTQINFLCQLIKSQPELLAPEPKTGTRRVFQIFKIFGKQAQMLRSKKPSQSQQMKDRMRSSLIRIRSWGLYRSCEGAIFGELNQGERVTLRELIGVDRVGDRKDRESVMRSSMAEIPEVEISMEMRMEMQEMEPMGIDQ